MSEENDDTSSEANGDAEEESSNVNDNMTEDSAEAEDSTAEQEGTVDHMADMAAAMAEDAASEATEEKEGAVDHMAEMAAAMAEDSAATATEEGAVDHMAEMAEAMAGETEADTEEINTQSAESIAKSVSSKDVNIETLLKVPVSLAIEVGRTQMSMNDLLYTHEGSVIELERLLDEPLDILVNGALIAHGVVVLANERFGLQITDIISLEDRARSL